MPIHRKLIIYGAVFLTVSLLTVGALLYRANTFSSAKSKTPKLATQTTLTDFDKMTLLVEDVRVSNGYKYDAHDTSENNLDAIKIIQPTSARQYVGVYHSNKNGVFTLKVGESTDLLTWTFKGDIEANATHGEIMAFPEGDFLLAYENFTTTSSMIRLRQYKDYESLKKGVYIWQKDLPRSLSKTNEGTPNFISVKKKSFNKKSGKQDWSESEIKLGFHFYDSVSDKNATGILTNGSTWKSQPNAIVNSYFTTIGYTGNYGDRDYFSFKFNNSVNINYIIHEAQMMKDQWESWRSFLYDATNSKFQQLDPYTHKRSISFANPSVTYLTLPDGNKGLFVSYYVFSEGAAAGEAGSLIFYTKAENVAKATPREQRDPFPNFPSPTPAEPTPTPVPSESPTPIESPTPSVPAVTCTCTQPGGTVPNNGFTCSDGDSRYCAPDEACTSTSEKPNWPCSKI